MKNSKTSRPPVIIDATDFPHIIDAVLDAVRPSPAAFLPLAKVCRAWRDTVYKHIFAEIGITPIEGYPPNSAIRRLLAYRLTTITEPVLRFELKVANDLEIQRAHFFGSESYVDSNLSGLSTASTDPVAHSDLFRLAVAPLNLRHFLSEESFLSQSFLAAVRILNVHGKVPNALFTQVAFPDVRVVRCTKYQRFCPVRALPVVYGTMVLHATSPFRQGLSYSNNELGTPSEIDLIKTPGPASLRTLVVVTHSLCSDKPWTAPTDIMLLLEHHVPFADEIIIIIPPWTRVWPPYKRREAATYEPAAVPGNEDICSEANYILAYFLVHWFEKEMGSLLGELLHQSHVTLVVNLTYNPVVNPRTTHSRLAPLLKAKKVTLSRVVRGLLHL